MTYAQQPAKIAKAAQWDGKWVLVTNQPRLAGQSSGDYLDWMWQVYKNHSHIERRMRNLKSDLPIRPLYLHRDEALLALCFVSVLALMLYTLIERDCQNTPALVAAGLTSTDRVLATLASCNLTVLRTPSGWEVFWLDISSPLVGDTHGQPATHRPATPLGGSDPPPAGGAASHAPERPLIGRMAVQSGYGARFGVGKVLIVMLC